MEIKVNQRQSDLTESNQIYNKVYKLSTKNHIFSSLFSFSLLSQRILNQVQHRRQQKKGNFSRGIFSFSL